MKLKTSYLYQVMQLKNSVLGFYAIYFAIIVTLFCIIPLSLSSTSDSSANRLTGMESATSIFLAIIMLEVFKEHLLMLIQHGISRKSYFIGRFLTIGSIALLMSVLDTIFFFLLKKVVSSVINNFTCYSLYESVYPARISQTETFLDLLERTGFHFFVYCMVMSFAFLFSIFYYRINKTWRILVCAGTPITLILILPIVDYRFFRGKLSTSIGHLGDSTFGITINKPLYGVITLSLLSILFAFIAWLLIRKISIKE